MKYTTVFFDLDNTLLDFDKAEAVAVRKVLSDNLLPSDDAAVQTYSAINKSFWERFERGEIPREAIFAGRFAALLEAFEIKGDAEALSAEYAGRLANGYYTIDGATDILGHLKQKGYYLAATTNGLSSTQYRRIENSGIRPFFDGIFVSEDTGYRKPEKEYFDYVIGHIPETDRSKILIVGDSQSSDILGGVNSGIDTCWYNRSMTAARYPSRYEITALSELKNIL